MKRISIVIALLLVALQPALADRVSPETAQQVARQFFNNNEKKCVVLNDCSKAAGFENLYIFNTENGFVVISADDRALPILGYSMTGTFNAYQLPEHIKGWLQGYDNEIRSAIENDLQATAEVRQQWQQLKAGAKGAKATVVVAPLLTTLWDQGEPYNNLCPTVSNTATYSGCVATSMAQVMKYWNWPIKGNSSKSYRWNSQTLTANFGNTTYDWANMTDTYDSNSTEAENAAVATLMYHCGVSVSMSYGTDGSGAYSNDIPTALKSYFRYNSATYKQKSYTSNWDNTIKAELDAGRPVQYSGSGSGGGHAFVCDGYDSNSYFHFNWGWSGSCDGYYSLSSLAPGTGGAGAGTTGDFTNSQAAVINIVPTYSITNAPSNVSAALTQDIATRNVNVSWSALSGASSYQVFRNTQLIGTTTTTSFTDVNAPYGDNQYYVRGLNSSNGISPYSNKATVSISFPAPTNLTASLKEDLFTVSWEPSALAVSYNLYCNDRLVASDLTENEITFTLRVYGDLTFYVRAIDFSGLSSDASNTASLNQPFRGPLVDDLKATLDGNSAQITWTALESSTSYLKSFGDYNGSIWLAETGSSSKVYWAVRYTPAMLSFCAGMALVDAETYIYEAGTYQVSVYQGTGDTPSGTALATASGTFSANDGWKALTFDSPVPIDHTKDLWVVYSANVTYFLLAEMENENSDFYSTDGKTWKHYTGAAWIVYADFTDGEYTYNLYRNGTCIAQKMTNTSYTDASLGNNGAYRYTVRTNYYGGESDDSNFCEYVLGEASHNESITMTRNDYLFVTENSHLTVKGDVSNSYPSHLVIRPNAQLTATSAFAGTMQKNIGAYSTGTTVNDGWHLLASPVFEDTPVADITNLIPDNADDYDLYWFDQVGDSEGKEWMNYKVENQQPDWKVGEGRLYANKQGTTLSFAGTLNKQPGNGIPVAYEAGYDFSGFNLIGNPFTSEAYLSGDFYRMNETGTELVVGSGAIKPCEGVFVKVNQAGFATFTTTPAKQNGISLDVSNDAHQRNETTRATERAVIRFDGTDVMPKFMLDRSNTSLCFPQADKDYAVVQHHGETELPLNFHAAESGSYTLSVNIEDIEMDYLHLIDNLTGADIDLLKTPSYSFQTKTTDYASRFRLVLSPAGTNNGHFAFFNGSEWVVSNEGEATLQVIDMMGRVLSSQTINGNANVKVNEAKGVYVMRLIQNGQVSNQKIVKE